MTMTLHRMMAVVAAAVVASALLVAVPSTTPADAAPTYRNPLTGTGPDGIRIENCPDPSIIRAADPADPHWYVYCTTDPLSSDDRDEAGDLRFRLMPILRSTDLVSWTHAGDVFAERPAWVADDAGLWAPEIVFIDGRYVLYYTASDTAAGGSAIGVATAPSPTGPFTDAGAPLIGPIEGRWTFDPAHLEHEGTRYLYYGSYVGGLFVSELSADGLSIIEGTETRIAVEERYEGPYVIERDGVFWLFASATDCCRGPLTGYSVFAARADHPTGPFVDRDGASLLDAKVGGTPVLSMNGNRWVGTGHNAVFTDFAGQDWFLYHAVDRHDPYFEGEVGFTKRPLMLDPLDWVDGWPTVRAGRWASDTPQPAPAAQPGDRSRYRPQPLVEPRLGKLIDGDEFDGRLDSSWSWVRPRTADEYEVGDGVLRLTTQAADLYQDSNDASVLLRDAPDGPFAVETRVRLDLPEGCCEDFVQAGLVLYDSDDRFLKLADVSIFTTRQTEFAKEVDGVDEGYPRYGNTVVGPVGEWTGLRLVVRRQGGEQHVTAYTQRDDGRWVRGGTWTHDLDDPRIGLVAMGGEGFVAEFDHVRVYRLTGPAGGRP